MVVVMINSFNKIYQCNQIMCHKQLLNQNNILHITNINKIKIYNNNIIIIMILI